MAPNFSLPTDGTTRYAQFAVRLSVPPAVATLLQDAGKPVPPPVDVDAIIDTGATHTTIPHGVGAKLGLAPIDVVPMGTASQTQVMCPRFSMRINFPTDQWYDGTVVELPASNSLPKVLLGCDILAWGVLIYNGQTRSFTLCF